MYKFLAASWIQLGLKALVALSNVLAKLKTADA